MPSPTHVSFNYWHVHIWHTQSSQWASLDCHQCYHCLLSTCGSSGCGQWVSTGCQHQTPKLTILKESVLSGRNKWTCKRREFYHFSVVVWSTALNLVIFVQTDNDRCNWLPGTHAQRVILYKCSCLPSFRMATNPGLSMHTQTFVCVCTLYVYIIIVSAF